MDTTVAVLFALVVLVMLGAGHDLDQIRKRLKALEQRQVDVDGR